MSISLSEVVVVLVVAIVFIKPENLPATALTAGKWFKWLRQATQQVRRELEKPFEKITAPPPRDESPHE